MKEDAIDLSLSHPCDNESKPVTRCYFDHNATTPVAPEVLEAHTAVLRDLYGNASSIHTQGQAARQKLEAARRDLAAFLGCRNKDLIFTSGGTEAANLAILGAVRAAPKPNKHVITTAIEHPAVGNACSQLQSEGVTLTVVTPNRDGVVTPDAIEAAIRPETVLISVMHANNETGAVQPIREIALVARNAGILLHSDGVQAAGKLPIDLSSLGPDLYSISAHKLNASKGTGLLYLRPGVPLQPLQFGGRHEQGFRPGTENVAGAVSLAVACARHTQEERERLRALRQRLETAALHRIPEVSINAGRAERLPNTTNLLFEGIEAEPLVIALDLKGFATSTGSACSSGAVAPSHVLTAMGLTPSQARSSLRISLGMGNDEAQVDALVDALESCVARLRRLSPKVGAHV